MIRPESFKGARPGSRQLSRVDYRLARESVIRAFKGGRSDRLDVCDAHPELMRVASSLGDPSKETCPICEESKVVLVSYAFGSGLAPGGHVVTSRADVTKLKGRTNELTCYVVEVCPACGWNHLAESFQVPGRKRA